MNFRMAFAALEAMEELDLFGIHGGGPSSKIHVMLDEAQKVIFFWNIIIKNQYMFKSSKYYLEFGISY